MDTNNKGVIHLPSLQRSKRAAVLLAAAVSAFANDRANGTAWLRMIAAKAALQASMDAHPAGKGRRS